MRRFFGAIGRTFKIMVGIVTFGMLKFTEDLEMSEAGVDATYDDINDAHIKTMKQAMKGISITTRMKNELEADLEALNNDLGTLYKQRSGAEALIKKRLGVVGKDKIKQDTEYQRLANLFNRVDTKIEGKEAEADRLEKELEGTLSDLEQQEREYAELADEQREIEKERAATQSDLAYAKAKKELAETRAGISTNGAGESRQRMQKLRRQRNAEAEAVSRVSGAANDNEMKALEREAAAIASNDKLDALLGLSSETETATTVADEVDDKLPE